MRACPAVPILSGCVDYVLPPAGIARELVADRPPPLPGRGTAEPRPSSRSPTRTSSRSSTLRPAAARPRGVDFSRYKRNTILRRIRRRMALLPHRPARRLPAEAAGRARRSCSALYQDFLIRVTSFFRDPPASTCSSEQIFPALIRDRPARPADPHLGGRLRDRRGGLLARHRAAGVPGRRAGEHADQDPGDRHQRAAPGDGPRPGSTSRTSRWTSRRSGCGASSRRRQRVTRSARRIRDLCIFSRHDMTRDPPFARLDLISCRNVLIYFDLALQKRVLPLFHYALKPGGYLMLGPSESIGAFGELFAPRGQRAQDLRAESDSVRRPALRLRDRPRRGARRAGGGAEAAIGPPAEAVGFRPAARGRPVLLVAVTPRPAW